MRPPLPSTPTARGLASCAARGVLLTLLGFGLVSTAFRWALPWPRDGGLAAKIALFEETRDEWDAVLFGSSRVVHGLIPEVVEAELAAAGTPLKVFNLAVDAMGSFETDYVVRHVLSLQPARLRYALIELEAYEPLTPGHRRFKTARELHWHDLRQTRAVLESIRLARITSDFRRLFSRAHVELFLKRLFNIGRGRWWIDEQLGGELLSAEVDTDELRRSQGFITYDMTPGGDLFKVHRRFLANLDTYDSRLEALADHQPGPGDLATYNVEALEAQVALLTEHDVTPVHFLGPSSQIKAFVGALAAADSLPTLLDFHKPREHPELYAVEHRFDPDHLNLTGAQLFSRLFARKLLRRILSEETH